MINNTWTIVKENIGWMGTIVRLKRVIYCRTSRPEERGGEEEL
jgi:hypothetical protein